MNVPSNIEKLKYLTNSLIDKALTEIRSNRQESSTTMEEHFRTAEYLLLEAKEYVEGAWEMIASKSYGASLALSRWLLEASINLLWAVDDQNEVGQRLKDLVGEALRRDAILCEGLAELWPNHDAAFKSKAKKAKQIRRGIVNKKIDPLKNRLDKIIRLNHSDRIKLYALYRICCAYAHPSLKVWERFLSIGNATVSKKPNENMDKDKRKIAFWMAATSTQFLVTGAYCLTNLRRKKQLNDWWINQAEPLLNDI